MPQMKDRNPEILTALRETLYPYRSDATDAFVDFFQQRYPRSLQAIIAYGSRLSQVTATSTSIFDFFLLCDDYRSFYQRPLLAGRPHGQLAQYREISSPLAITPNPFVNPLEEEIAVSRRHCVKVGVVRLQSVVSRLRIAAQSRV